MDIFSSLAGTLWVELTSADVAAALTSVSNAGIQICDVQQTGDLSVTMRIERRDYRRLYRLCKWRGEQLTLKSYQGIYWPVKRLLQRPVLLVGLMLLLTAMVYLPSRVIFVQVEGNASIPSRLIVAKAESCGIYFGASRSAVRSERVKNALLAAIPELQWAGVNTRGCVAVISVRERTDVEIQEEEHGVCSIVASRDSVVTQCTVTRGNAICKVGQAVREGEVLVSGYTDCGIMIQATRAEAEVLGQTTRSISVIAPSIYNEKGCLRTVEKKYSLLLGKKRINFYKDSGIYSSSCDKMYLEYYLTLPGGFQLPAALIVEWWEYYEPQEVEVVEDEAFSLMSSFAEGYLLNQMVSGEILHRNQSVGLADGVYTFEGGYICQEMIGRVQSEEIVTDNEQSDRKNRQR